MADDESAGPRRIQTVDNTLEIIRILYELESANLRDIVDRVDISKGTVHTHLHTLSTQGLVKKTGDRYRLGELLLVLGDHVRRHHPIYEPGRSQVERLASTTKETVHLIALFEDQAIQIHMVQGERALESHYNLELDEQYSKSIHTMAAGKAILAELPDERVEEIVRETGLKRHTTRTITDRDDLFQELERIREQGYAQNNEEETAGLRAVGAAIVGDGNRPLGAISVAAPRSRMDDEMFNQELPSAVVEATNLVELNIDME